MIITKTPLRMSFAGGGSDLRNFYKRYGGAVLSTTIDKYIYVNINKKFDDGIRVAYSKNEEVSKINELEHPLVKAALDYVGIQNGVEITTIADIPSKGTGLGSSSSFTAGLLNALHEYNHYKVPKSQLARESCHIEINMCNEPIGKQDQYAAVFGGFNLIEFKKDDSVVLTPVKCSDEIKNNLQNNIIVFYTGINRSASKILEKQTKDMNRKNKQDIVKEMVDLCYLLFSQIQDNDITNFGQILDQCWMLKKRVNNDISNTSIDNWYERAKLAGAEGGKLMGAGAGGFLMFYADRSKHADIISSLSDIKLVPMKFDNTGSTIVYNDAIEH